MVTHLSEQCDIGCLIFKNLEEVKSCVDPGMDVRMGCVIAFSSYSSL